jgi:hypothetical protein
MKYKILIILLLTNLALFGQDSKTFVDTNKLWSVYWDYSFEGLPGDNYTYYIKITDDTNITSTTYKKVMRSNDEFHSTWFNYGYIRETPDKKIYYLLNNQDTIEKFIFNENANVSDTLLLYNEELSCSTYVIDSIDSVLINGQYRKRFNPDMYWGNWIEGIGSNTGFDNTGIILCWVGGIRELLCCTENDTLIFTNPSHNFCYQGTVNLNESSNDNIHVTISPNPVTTSSVFNADNSNWTNNILEIYSYSGQKLKTIRLDKQMIINKSDFTSGLYIYRLITKTNILTGKFEVE